MINKEQFEKIVDEAVVDENLQELLFDDYDGNSIKLWKQVSEYFASLAQGTVHVVLGEQVREDSKWKTVELPTLIQNKKVSMIIALDFNGEESGIVMDRRISNEELPKINGQYPSRALIEMKLKNQKIN